MGHFGPDRMDSTGKRDIASHDYPWIGPYDSADPNVLEYHALLMKISGIDGVLADWYGPEDFNDYAMIHRRTGLLFDMLKRRALDSGSPFIQIITWNDFGEGTNVEPTREHEYRDLEAVQEARRQFPDRSFAYGPADLCLPHRIYRLRQRIPRSSAERRKRVDEMVDLLFAGDTGRVSRQLDELEKLVQ